MVAMDPTVLMNLEEKVKPWPNMADSDVANSVFSSPEYKFIPIIDPTQWRRQENDQTMIQRGTDIHYNNWPAGMASRFTWKLMA